jgi:hypothetical protein
VEFDSEAAQLIVEKFKMAKTAKKRSYKTWTKDDLKELKQHSREQTPITKIARAMKRSEATIRMKAYQLGFSVGHRRRKGTKARR